MATQDSFEFDYAPGYTKPTHLYGTEFGDEFHAPAVKELLVSMVGYRQRGVTLAGGQGLLPTGCALGKKTSDGKYYVYAAAQSDGRQVCVGFLRDARDTGGASSPAGRTSADCLGNLVYSGVVSLALVSGTDTTSLVANAGGGIGSGTTGAVKQLNGRVDQDLGAFIF